MHFSLDSFKKMWLASQCIDFRLDSLHSLGWIAHVCTLAWIALRKLGWIAHVRLPRKGIQKQKKHIVLPVQPLEAFKLGRNFGPWQSLAVCGCFF